MHQSGQALALDLDHSIRQALTLPVQTEGAEMYAT